MPIDAPWLPTTTRDALTRAILRLVARLTDHRLRKPFRLGSHRVLEAPGNCKHSRKLSIHSVFTIAVVAQEVGALASYGLEALTRTIPHWPSLTTVFPIPLQSSTLVVVRDYTVDC